MKKKLVSLFPIFFHDHYKFLSEQFDHSLICDEKFTHLVPKNIEIKVIPLKAVSVLSFLHRKTQLSTPVYLKGLTQVLREENPDYLVVTDFFQLFFWQCILFIRGRKHIKLILYSETKRLSRNLFPRFVMRYMLYLVTKTKAVSAIFTFTLQSYEFYTNYFQGTGIQIVLLPSPADTLSFSAKESGTHEIHSDLKVLMNARFVTYKRHIDLLRAVKLVIEKGVSISVTLVGRDESGRLEVEQKINELGLRGVIKVIDPIPYQKLPDLYQSHDVLVLPSDNEAIGMVVPEAMACGLPTITSDTVGANVYVKEGETGLIFKTGDYIALAEAITKLKDASVRKNMGQAAREHIEGYSVEKMGAKFKEALLAIND